MMIPDGVVRARPRAGRKTGQRRKRDVHAESRRAALVALHALAEIASSRSLGSTSLRNSSFGLTFATMARAGELAAVGEHHRARPHLATGASHSISTPTGAPRRASASLIAPMPPMAWPHAALAVHLAEAVVQQHIGGARVERAGVVADHRVETERRLDRFGLEPVVEPVGRAAGEQPEQVALRFHVELSDLRPN